MNNELWACRWPNQPRPWLRTELFPPGVTNHSLVPIIGDGESSGKCHCTADLLFTLFGFSCFAYGEWTTFLLVWLNPKQSNRRSAVEWNKYLRKQHCITKKNMNENFINYYLVHSAVYGLCSLLSGSILLIISLYATQFFMKSAPLYCRKLERSHAWRNAVVCIGKTWEAVLTINLTFRVSFGLLAVSLININVEATEDYVTVKEPLECKLPFEPKSRPVLPS